jgi:hypothetical protein
MDCLHPSSPHPSLSNSLDRASPAAMLTQSEKRLLVITGMAVDMKISITGWMQKY